ncbi:MAG: hypothetical protein NE327_02875 [Lentisphaeraceae bacterium]|nr:hypothetical protein [Lentisphaeraceae bacterium]
MSYYDEEPDYLSHDEIEEIQEEYRKKRLYESLVGPSVSTGFHIVLIMLLAFMIQDKFKEEANEIEVVIEQPPEPITIPLEPPQLKDLEPTEIPVVSPVSVASPTADINDNALDDVSDDAPESEDFDQDTISDIIVSDSAITNPSVIGGKTPGGNKGLITKHGVDIGTYTSFIKCLQWLAKVQNADGSWGNEAKAGYTGLALLTFLAHGETPTSRRYGSNVKKAMKWLAEDKMDTKSHHGYPHAIKTYAVSEAYAMTGISILKKSMDDCVEIIVKGQQQGGAFDYNYRASENRQDLSFSGWNYQALKAAYLAGCDVKGLQESIYKSLEYLKLMGDSEKSFAYTTSNSDPDQSKGAGKWTMKAVGALCLQLLEPGEHAILKDELDSMLKEGVTRFNWNKAPGRSLYGWYYETNAMFHAQGKYWKGWKDKFAKVLMENQHPEGYWVYPGNNHMPGSELSKKIYATTLSALMLSVPFRYLPSSRVVSAIPAKEAKMKKGPQEVMKEEGIDLIK